MESLSLLGEYSVLTVICAVLAVVSISTAARTALKIDSLLATHGRRGVEFACPVGVDRDPVVNCCVCTVNHQPLVSVNCISTPYSFVVTFLHLQRRLTRHLS